MAVFVDPSYTRVILACLLHRVQIRLIGMPASLERLSRLRVCGSNRVRHFGLQTGLDLLA
jgi:hypothetical protein